MKEADDPNPPSQLRDDAKWIKKVVEEEQVKPLEVIHMNTYTYELLLVQCL